MRRAVRWTLIALVVLLGACVLSAIFVGPSVYRAARDGRESLLEGSKAVLRRDADAARVEFAAARDLFASSDRKLRSPLAWPLRITPVASTHVGVARSLARIGSGIGSSGVAIADTMRGLPEESLTFTDGRVDLSLVKRAAAALRFAATNSQDMTQAIADMPTGWVGGPLVEPRAQALDLLPPIIDGVLKAEAAMSGLPSILGETEPKRYLVAFSNLAELRGSGGLYGYVTSLRAQGGDLDLEDFSGRPTDVFPAPGSVGLAYPDWFPDDLRTQAKIFQNVNMSTDFPTVGRFVVATANAELSDVDGVIAVDPIGIGAVLSLTGPIEVPLWPRPISADNVAKIAMHDAYIAITDNDVRETFFGQLVRTAFGKLTSTRVDVSAESAGVFDRAIGGGHFTMYSDHQPDQATFEDIGAARGVARTAGATDVLGLVSENAGGNKMDYYLRRDFRYRVQLDPSTRTATAAISATFRNTAPDRGLPDYIIGSKIEGFPVGTNRQFVVLLRPSGDSIDGIAVDGRPAVNVRAQEVNLHAYRTTVDVDARSRSQLVSTSVVRDALVPDGDDLVYRLHVLRQPTASPDFAEIEITAPSGWAVAGQRSFAGDLRADAVLEVRLRRTTVGSLLHEPLGAVRRFFQRVF